MSAQEKLTKEAHATQTDTAPMSRREFLGLTGSGLFVFFWAEPDGFFQEAAHPSQRSGYPEDFNAYLRIASDGRVTCLVGKIEMGEGVMTSLPMMLADELDVWRRRDHRLDDVIPIVLVHPVDLCRDLQF